MVATTPYRHLLHVDPERLARVTTDLLANPEAAVFVAEHDGALVGMLAMLVYPHPFSGERLASEVVWFTDPQKRGDGVRLLKAAEVWARAHGATVIQMIAPTEKVGAFYQAVGYVPVETSYQRRL